jgi:hypothetical protein
VRNRIRTLFDLARSYAAQRFPWISQVKLTFCPLADRHHAHKWRQFAHTNHRVYTVCFARASDWELTDEEVLGLVAHELGHIVGTRLRYPEHTRPIQTKRTPKAVQDEADRIAREVLGFNIQYNKRTIQELRHS